MVRSQKTAVVFGVLAALFWSPHFHLLQRLQAGDVPASVLVLNFYFVLGAAGAVLLVLFLSGRLSELRIFNRRETHFLLLAAAGGYGFWVLRALALGAVEPARARVLFYAAPLLIGVLSALTREKADPRALVGLLLGFVGCIVLLAPGRQMGGSIRGTLLGLAAAACWAVFSLAARPLAREEKALPVVALVTGIGAVCLLVTCLSTRDSIFNVRPGQLASAMAGGVFTVGIMMALWLRCLAGMPAVLASGLWHLGLLFATLWAYLGFAGQRPSGWWLLIGGVLIVLGLHSILSGRQRRAVTIGDIIRG